MQRSFITLFIIDKDIKENHYYALLHTIFSYFYFDNFNIFIMFQYNCIANIVFNNTFLYLSI